MKYQFSVLVAMYNVEAYIEAFLKSLDNQEFGIDNIEILAVDDGSTDRSASIFENWARRKPNVTLIRQQNQGPGAARNRALREATGRWVTVIDPDDIVDRQYFSSTAEFIARDNLDTAALLESRVYILNDITGEFRDTHPLGRKFRFGDRLARLADEPEAFQLGATAFFRREVLDEHQLTYDDSIRPTFEDAHLIGRYLSKFDDPVVGIVSRAHYYYRKRAADNSLVQSSWGTIDRFVNTPVRGYLDMLNFLSRGESAPVWAQYMVLYDLLWYFKEDQNMISKVSWIDEGIRSRFLKTVSDIMQHIDSDTIREFPCNPHPWVLRQSLLLNYASSPLSRIEVYRWKSDSLGNANISILYSGRRPDIRVYSDGSLVSDPTVDYTSHRYFGEVFMTEETWSFAGSEVAVFADGRVLKFSQLRSPSWKKPSTTASPSLEPRAEAAPRNSLAATASKVSKRIEVSALTTARSRKVIVGRKSRGFVQRFAERRRLQGHNRRVQENIHYANLESNRARFDDCWLVMDRPNKADDNGEHFYRYLLRSHPDVNAFFVLSKSSPDWNRLSSEGFRLLEYESRELIAASMNSTLRVSSDATADVMYPAPRSDYGQPKGHFVFLQHGVTMNDLSRWLNPKAIDLMICASAAEYSAFVDEVSFYKFRKRNFALTGFARYDSLFRLAVNTSKSSILIMPTWRSNVRDRLQAVAPRERLSVLESTDYGASWMEFLRSEELVSLKHNFDIDINVVLHPSLDLLVPDLGLPDGLTRVDMSTTSFQELLASAKLFVTDYSSLAFDAAYAAAPTVYYQFDRSTFFAGGHNYRQGYFDFEDDGFGPVTESASEAVSMVGDIVSGSLALDCYLDRINSTFVWRDDNNCERIYSAIAELIS